MFEVCVGFSGLESEFRAAVIVAVSSKNKSSHSNHLVFIMSSSPKHKMSQYLSTEEYFILSIISLRSLNIYVYIFVF
jgi:hypothetical protein